MTDKVFLDTNVLLYGQDRHDPVRKERALNVVRKYAGRIVVSTQVMQEFFVGATGKLGVEALEAKEILHAWSAFEIVRIGPELIARAIDIKILNQISFWDALIVAAAAAGNCQTLLTEDLNNGQTIAGVRIRNPFGNSEF